jgi:drug/metabolite transporter (DMT)-like permease
MPRICHVGCEARRAPGDRAIGSTPRLRHVLGPPLALGSSLTGGACDFIGGTTSRRIGTMQYMFLTQLIGVLLAGVWVALSGETPPGLVTLAAATGAGLGLMVGLAAFFQAMVVGTISIVAPISATGVVVPIVAGIVGGNRLGAAQAAGIVAAIGGIVLAARPPREVPHAAVPPATTESGLGLALVAAVGGGLYFWLLAPASRHGVPWALLNARAIPVLVLAVAICARRASLRPSLESPIAGAIVVSSVLAFVSVALYAFATRHGQLAIVSVLASLYPVVTVLLAYRVLGERVHRAQQLGIVTVLAGVVLMSAG